MPERKGYYTPAEQNAIRNDRYECQKASARGRKRESDRAGFPRFFGGIDLPKKETKDDTHDR